MGLEAACIAKLGTSASRGKALLETTELVFRGEFRVRVPLGEVESVAVDGASGRLVLGWRGQTLSLELGAEAAPRWADKIRHPPSRLDKLGVKPTSRVAIVGHLDDDFVRELRTRAAEVTRNPAGGMDLLFFAVETRAALEEIAPLARHLVPDGALWVVRPKGQPVVTERDVMEAGKAAGLVDVKVAAFSATHTAEKFVVPLARREAALKPSRARARSLPPGRPKSPPAKTRRRPARTKARPG